MSTPRNEPHNPYSAGGPNYDAGSFNQPPQFHGQTPGGSGRAEPLNPAQLYRGGQIAQVSMILGILSIILSFVGFILGPIAIVQARKAEREFHSPAIVGKVTGWIGTIFGLLWLLVLVLGLIGLFAFAPGGN